METPIGINVAGIIVATSSVDCVQARKKKLIKIVDGNERISPDTLLLDFSARKVSKLTSPPPTKKLITN